VGRTNAWADYDEGKRPLADAIKQLGPATRAA
jgi:hypothetical protein